MIDKYFRQLKIILLGFDIFSFILAFCLANALQVVWLTNQRNTYLLASLISAIIIIVGAASFEAVFQNPSYGSI